MSIGKKDLIEKLVLGLLREQREDGAFSPFTRDREPVISHIFSLYSRKIPPKSIHLKRFYKLLMTSIYWHTYKCAEVFDKLAPMSQCSKKASEWRREYEDPTNKFVSFPSNEEVLEAIRLRVYAKIARSWVDLSLHTLLLYYPRFKEKTVKKIIIERVLENIYFPDQIQDPANLFWALLVWKNDKEIFEKVISETNNDLLKDRVNFDKLLNTAKAKIKIDIPDDTAFVEPTSPPPFDVTPEIYGEPRSTAFTYLNLVKIEESNNETKNLLNWIEQHHQRYNNPYLKALLIEVLYFSEFSKNDKNEFQKIVLDCETKAKEKKLEFGQSFINAKDIIDIIKSLIELLKFFF